MNNKGFFHGLDIGGVKLEGNLLLGPMAGSTDSAFRRLCRKCSGDPSEGLALVCTEMVSAKAIVYNNAKTLDLLRITEDEGPAAVQLFGSEPEVFSEAVSRIRDMRFDILDINMGCPMPKITGNGDGSALMRDPALIEKIVRAAGEAAQPRPVTVKLRTGFDDDHINVVECALAAEAGGAKAVTVHGRTRKQLYSGEVDIRSIRETAGALKIPVIGNGNVTDGESARRMFEETGCDGIMIARAARGNPRVFREVSYYLETGKELPEMSAEKLHELVMWYIDAEGKDKGEYLAARELKGRLVWFIKGVPGSARLRERINAARDLDEMREIMENAIQ